MDNAIPKDGCELQSPRNINCKIEKSCELSHIEGTLHYTIKLFSVIQKRKRKKVEKEKGDYMDYAYEWKFKISTRCQLILPIQTEKITLSLYSISDKDIRFAWNILYIRACCSCSLRARELDLHVHQTIFYSGVLSRALT